MLKVGNKFFDDIEDYQDRCFEVNPMDLISDEIRDLISNLPKDESDELAMIGYKSYKKKDYIDAIKIYTKAIELNSNNKNALFYRGLSFMNVEKYIDSVNDFSSFIKLRPGYFRTYLYRGNALLLLQTYDHIKAAINDYSVVISNCPHKGIVFFLRGYCYFLLKMEGQAKIDWLKSKELGITRENEENWKEDYLR